MKITEFSDISKVAIQQPRVSRILQGEKLCLEFNICLIAYRFPTIVGVSNNFQQSQQSTSNNCWKYSCFRNVNVKEWNVWQTNKPDSYLEHYPIHKTHILSFWAGALFWRTISWKSEMNRNCWKLLEIVGIVGIVGNNQIIDVSQRVDDRFAGIIVWIGQCIYLFWFSINIVVQLFVHHASW